MRSLIQVANKSAEVRHRHVHSSGKITVRTPPPLSVGTTTPDIASQRCPEKFEGRGSTGTIDGAIFSSLPGHAPPELEVSWYSANVGDSLGM